MRAMDGSSSWRSSFFASLFFLFSLTCSTFLPALSTESSAGECARVGDTTAQVLRFCGEPSWVDNTEEVRHGVRHETMFIDDGRRRWITRPVVGSWIVQIEEWTYNLGPTKFVRIFTFEDRILVSMSTGGYGY